MAGLVRRRRWRLGTREFVAAGSSTCSVLPLRAAARTTIYLGNENELVAAIAVGAPLRAEARAAADALRAQGVELTIASGDQDEATDSAARALGIRHPHARFSRRQTLAGEAAARARAPCLHGR